MFPFCEFDVDEYSLLIPYKIIFESDFIGLLCVGIFFFVNKNVS